MVIKALVLKTLTKGDVPSLLPYLDIILITIGSHDPANANGRSNVKDNEENVNDWYDKSGGLN